MIVLAALLLLLAIVAVFAAQNAHVVAVNLLGWHFAWPLAGVVLVTLVAGALVALLVGLFRQVSLRLRIHDTSGRLRKSEADLVATKTEMTRVRGDLDRVRAEMTVGKASLVEKEENLVAVRAELAVAKHELEEAKRRLPSSDQDRQPTAAKGGEPGGSNPRQR